MTYTSNAALETLDSRKTSQGLTPISNIQVRRTMFHHMLSFVHSVVPKWNTRNRPFQGATMRNSSSALKTSGCHDGVGVAGDEVPTQVVHNELVHASLQWPYESTLPPCCTIHTHPDRRSQGRGQRGQWAMLQPIAPAAAFTMSSKVLRLRSPIEQNFLGYTPTL